MGLKSFTNKVCGLEGLHVKVIIELVVESLTETPTVPEARGPSQGRQQVCVYTRQRVPTRVGSNPDLSRTPRATRLMGPLW